MAVNLVERAQKILTAPNSEWDVVAAEKTDVQAMFLTYVLPLVGAQALVAVLGLMLFQHVELQGAVIQFALNVVIGAAVVFILAFVIDGLAPNFGAQKDFTQSFKVAAYSPTPLWVFGLIAIVPQLGILGLLFGLYSLYLIFIGLPKVKKPKKDQEAVYALAAIGAIIVLVLVLTIVLRQLVVAVQGY
jgi:hypothetical protein